LVDAAAVLADQMATRRQHSASWTNCGGQPGASGLVNTPTPDPINRQRGMASIMVTHLLPTSTPAHDEDRAPRLVERAAIALRAATRN
jgi:hypothetical protein